MSQFINKMEGNYYIEVGAIGVFKDDLPNSIIYCMADILSSQVGMSKSSKGFLKEIFASNILPVPDSNTIVLCSSLEEYKKHVDNVIGNAAKQFNAKMDKFCLDIINKAFKAKVDRCLTKETAANKNLNIEKNQQDFFEEVLNDVINNGSYKSIMEALPKKIALVIATLSDTDLSLMNLPVDMLPTEDIGRALAYAREKIEDNFCIEVEDIYNVQEVVNTWMTAATDEQKQLLNYTTSETYGKQQVTYYVPEVDQKYVPVELFTSLDINKHFIIPPYFMMNDKIETELFAEKLIKISETINKLEKLNNVSIKMTIDNYQDLGNFRLVRVADISNGIVPVPVADKHNYISIDVVATKVTCNYPSTYKVHTKQAS